jgi:ABC-type dipeptide/oligopeptide/nickel transport system ATPase component
MSTDGRTRPEAGPLLEVDDLRTSFRTPRGRVKAVDGVSFTLDRGHALGIVGESGSGKTVLSRSTMGLLTGRSVDRTGSVRFEAAASPLARSSNSLRDERPATAMAGTPCRAAAVATPTGAFP